MTPISQAYLEMLLALQSAEARAAIFQAQHLPSMGGAQPSPDDLQDHVTAVTGDLAAALDNVEPGLGDRLMRAMFPHLDFDIEADIDAVLAELAAAGVLPRPGLNG